MLISLFISFKSKIVKTDTLQELLLLSFFRLVHQTLHLTLAQSMITQSALQTLYQTNVRRPLILRIGNNFTSKQFVRTYLVYLFFISKYKETDVGFKNDFQQQAKRQIINSQQPQEQEKIFNIFMQEHKRERRQQNKCKYILDSVFHVKLILNSIDHTLLHMENPHNILAIIFPMADIFNSIKMVYSQNIVKKRQLYIVAALNQKEQKQIAQMLARDQGCFYFSTFVKGFTVEKYARRRFLKDRPQQQGCENFFFTVNFPLKVQKLYAELDYGYYISPNEQTKVEGDVLFNILNSFKVISSSSRVEYNLQYGYIPYLYYSKFIDKSNNKNQSCLQIIEVCKAIQQNYLHSQSCLLRILKCPNLSMKISKELVTQFRRRSDLNRAVEMQIQVQLQNIVSNHIDRGQFNIALKQINNSSSFLSIAKKAQIFYKMRDFDKVKQLLIEFDSIRKSQKHLTEAQQKVQFIRAKLLIKEGRKEEAKQVLKDLHQRMRQKYQASYEVVGLPVLGAYEKLNGVFQNQKARASLQKTIEMAQINIQGFSTNIDYE